MEIKEAQRKVDERIKELGGYWQPLSMLARLTEEVGELARTINIKYGEKRAKNENDGGDLEGEIADIQLTIMAIANKFEVDIDEELSKKMEKDYLRNVNLYGTRE